MKYVLVPVTQIAIVSPCSVASKQLAKAESVKLLALIAAKRTLIANHAKEFVIDKHLALLLENVAHLTLQKYALQNVKRHMNVIL